MSITDSRSSSLSADEDSLNDLGDEFVAALRLVGELLKGAAGNDLKALLSGDAKLKIVPNGWKVTAPSAAKATTATSRAKSTVPPLPEIRAQLLAMSSNEEQRSMLKALAMNVTQSRALAKDLGVKGASKATVDEAIEMIIGYFR